MKNRFLAVALLFVLILPLATQAQAMHLPLPGSEGAVTVDSISAPQRTDEIEKVVPKTLNPDPLIQGMLDQVLETNIYTYDRQLVGELPVWVDGSWYTISTRYTYSGTPIQKTTHFVGQHMADLGMDVEYHVWNNDTNPNVIGQITGLEHPEDIYIIGGHLDAVSTTPGADDNASGSVATLIAADILSQYQWNCTLRFAFWTGEEQWMLGSAAYAQRAYNAGENILGYVNLDMIAWNTIGTPPDMELEYEPSIPASLGLANLFVDVVDAYQLNLLPVVNPNSGRGSDQAPFWDHGYSAILAIEDWTDFNPNYHEPGDTPANTDPAFFTDLTKAGIGTFAHLTDCLIYTGLGSLDGHVSADLGGEPIAGAVVTAEDSLGHHFPTTSDATGYYTRTLLADTYTVTASAYSYLPATFSGVEITTDTVTTQDFSLVSAPTHVVSGTVTESGTGLPLLAEVVFEGSPVAVYTDPASGFYQATLPEGSYTLQVSSASHRPQERAIVVDQDQTQDFTLELLPCILLVDDDKDAPDVRSYYTSTLDSLGESYDIWDTQTSGDPNYEDLADYRKLLWYTGYPWSNTFNSSNEDAVGTYLDGGGNFFLSSQDYLYERQLTAFGQGYLHILSFDNDVGQTTVMGQNVFNGLGPYALSYPFNNYSDVVNPDGQAHVAFSSNLGNAAISYDGQGFKTVFFGYPFEAISQPANRQAVMARTLGFFGECAPDYGWVDGHVTDAATGSPLEGVLVTVTPGKASIQAITDPTGYYTMTLPAGIYTATAETTGYASLSLPAQVMADEVTTVDFALTSTCEPLTGLDFSWLPAEPFNGEDITFSATAGGSDPIVYTWDFGDTSTGTGSTVTHTYSAAGPYTVALTAANACGSGQAGKEITILQWMWDFFLPLIHR